MYNQSKNLQVTQSQQLIAKGLMDLMREYPFEEITITQICQQAQVARLTFYRNFDAKIDILEYYIDAIFYEYFTKYYSSTVDIRQEITSSFDFLLIHRYFLVLLPKNDLLHLLYKAFRKYMSQFIRLHQIVDKTRLPDIDHEYVLEYVSASICATISLWIRNGFKEKPESLASLVKVFLSEIIP